MDTPAPEKEQIYRAIDQLSPEQLAQVWEYVQRLIEEPVAPPYPVHEQATGVTNLSEHQDGYSIGDRVGQAAAPVIGDGAPPMHAIEFTAKIRDGTIQVPEPYRHHLKDNVRVILMVEEQGQDPEDIIKKLLENPLNVPGFSPLSRDEIYAES